MKPKLGTQRKIKYRFLSLTAMPVFALPEALFFPDPEQAEPNGLLAVGGDLSIPRLIASYSKGIFPWYGEGTPILWWSPDPRPVIIPSALHISKSLKRMLNHNPYRILVDADFSAVIHGCAASLRPTGDGTWLVPEMIAAYIRLYQAGWAHSVEAYLNEELVGGIYGLALGQAFFAESMFFSRNDASKIALVHLAWMLQAWGYHFIDCQQETDHTRRFGAKALPRVQFQRMLNSALNDQVRPGVWKVDKGGASPFILID